MPGTENSTANSDPPGRVTLRSTSARDLDPALYSIGGYKPQPLHKDPLDPNQIGIDLPKAAVDGPDVERECGYFVDVRAGFGVFTYVDYMKVSLARVAGLGLYVGEDFEAVVGAFAVASTPGALCAGEVPLGEAEAAHESIGRAMAFRIQHRALRLLAAGGTAVRMRRFTLGRILAQQDPFDETERGLFLFARGLPE